ncbi:MAG: BON domain-containing protein [bacterium]|nr:BON domain-containing protein [bacterium]
MRTQSARAATTPLALLLATLVLPWCTGCPQMAITTAATEAASSLADDRSMEQQAADLDTKASIDKAFLGASASLAADVDVDVYLGHVMLTGVVPTWELRRQAVELARGVAGDAIYDDLEVAAGDGIGDRASDFAVNKELGVNLLAAEGIASQSLQHRVVNGVAFIMGEAHDAGQVETARAVALQTPGVSRVVTHIFIR